MTFSHNYSLHSLTLICLPLEQNIMLNVRSFVLRLFIVCNCLLFVLLYIFPLPDYSSCLRYIPSCFATSVLIMSFCFSAFIPLSYFLFSSVTVISLAFLFVMCLFFFSSVPLSSLFYSLFLFYLSLSMIPFVTFL